MGGEMGTRLMIVLTERMFAMLLLYQHYTGYSNQLANETNCFNEEVAHLLFFTVRLAISLCLLNVRQTLSVTNGMDVKDWP